MNNWIFRKLAQLETSGKGTSERNFRNEFKLFPSIFIREAFQNTLDARASKDPARVRIDFVGENEGLDTAYLSNTVHGLEPHVLAANIFTKDEFKNLTPQVLVFEEFNTT